MGPASPLSVAARCLADNPASRGNSRGPAGLQQPIFAQSPYFATRMPGIHITDIEAAINYWREKKPSPDGVTLAPELRALAEVYALLVFYHEDEADEAGFPPQALAAWRTWYDTTADTPCIAICSTSQGDALCKGCGRSFEEVQRWPEMSPGQKRATWRRITQEATAWRFGRYADRALENRVAAPPLVS